MAREFEVFSRELLLYLPPVMRDVAELQQIMAAEQPEIVALWERCQHVLDQQFLDSAGDYGVARWERILQIMPPAGDTLDQRKDRIYLILRVKLPYTIRWLRRWLDENVGHDHARVEVNRYTLDIWLDFDNVREPIVLTVMQLLGWVRPSNLVLCMTGQRERTGTINIITYPEQEVEIEIGSTYHSLTGGLLVGGFVEIQRNLCIGGSN